MIKKLKLLQRYNPYNGYWIDLLTERHIKTRKGECVDCIQCCRFITGGYCKHVDKVEKRCKIYDDKLCNEWFPVSQKEIDYIKTKLKRFSCKYYWGNDND